MWTLSQRKALLVLCLVLTCFLAIEAYRNPVILSDPPPNPSPRADEICDRLDPNLADASALAAIPNLGEKRAAEIVDFRDRFLRQHPGAIAFHSMDDLRQLKGIGPGTAANLTPYLVFGKTIPQSADLTAH